MQKPQQSLPTLTFTAFMIEEVGEMFIRQTEVPDPDFPWYLVSYAPFSTTIKIHSRHKTYEEAKEARTEENLIGVCFIATYVEVCHYLGQKSY